MHLSGCGRFWLWSAAGALVSFSLVAAASVGFLVLPVAALALFFIVPRTRDQAEMLGALVGAAGVCFAIALIQRGPGGFDARSWAVAGIVLAVAGLGGYAVGARRAAPRA
jgi:hypothetical protein